MLSGRNKSINFSRAASVLSAASLILALPSARADVPLIKPTADSEAKAAPVLRSSSGRILSKIEDLPNFHEVHPFLFRSGEPTEAGLRAARDKYNIKTIIDLRGAKKYIDAEKTWAKEMGLTYINLPMTAEPPTKAQVATMLKTIRDARDKKIPGAVLVHCAHGSDRTGCMIGIWRVTEDDFDYDKAYAEMRKYWFGTKFTKLAGAVKQAASSRKEASDATTR